MPDTIPVDDQDWIPDGGRPATPLEALMRCAPHQIPDESAEELQPLREAVADCMTALGTQDRFVLEATESERLSHRELGERLGMTKENAHNAHRYVVQARNNLEVLLRAHPIIQGRIPELEATSWEQAAADAVNFIRVEAAVHFPKPYKESVKEGKAALKDQWGGANLTRTLIELGATALAELYTHGLKAEDVTDILIDRHHKYGPGNILEFREMGILVRMSDKVARLANSREDFADEAATDALIDLVGYAAIAHMLWNGTFTLPFKEATTS